jgi:hypothetical protein
VTTDGRIVEIESFSTPGVRYEVDLEKKTCSCPAFRKSPANPCKHLRSFQGLFVEPPEPDPSEALSALIKSIRLRRTEDAVTWLLYLWRIPQFKARAQRRVLIAAAEDNLSVGVIRRVSEWYNTIERVKFESAAREIARICATPNWWAQPGGQEYIYAWAKAEGGVRALEGATEDFLYAAIFRHAEEKSLHNALTAFSALYARMRIVPHRVAELLHSLSSQGAPVYAKRLTTLYAVNLRHIGVDGNLAGQALYTAIEGVFADQVVPEPEAGEVRRSMALARENLARRPQIPAWALDGVHTGRYRDGRFAGTVRMMAACCRAYEHYGRLSIDDHWLPGFCQPAGLNGDVQ